MQKQLTLTLLTLGAVLSTASQSAEAVFPRRADRVALYHSSHQPWHDQYYHTQSGYPLALVVPPTAHAQQDWGWGVTHSETRPIHHQYLRPYQGDSYGGENSAFLPTPPWPSHTRQFGVYYIRGPW